MHTSMHHFFFGAVLVRVYVHHVSSSWRARPVASRLRVRRLPCHEHATLAYRLHRVLPPYDSEKTHENRLTVLRDTALKEMTALRQTNLRRLQELNAEIQRFEIEMREMEEVSFV